MASPWSVAKEGAQREGERGTGFDRDQDSGIRIADQLGAWQEAGDQRLFKLIVSPENGHALDLRDHTRRLMDALEDELGTKLEWVAIDHHNTGTRTSMWRCAASMNEATHFAFPGT